MLLTASLGQLAEFKFPAAALSRFPRPRRPRTAAPALAACGKTVPSDGVAAAQAAQDQLEQSLRLPVAPRAAGPGSGWHPGRARASAWGSGGDSVGVACHSGCQRL